VITRIIVSQPSPLRVSDEIRIQNEYGRVIGVDGDKVTIYWYECQWWHRLLAWLKGSKRSFKRGGRVVGFGVD